LKRATQPRGKKTELAQFLETRLRRPVPLPRVSEWLSGSVEPSGSVTLVLLEWVTAEEAKQKSPGSALTPPEQKTRGKVSRETKPKPPGRRKS
jgi:hypothetical protein